MAVRVIRNCGNYDRRIAGLIVNPREFLRPLYSVWNFFILNMLTLAIQNLLNFYQPRANPKKFENIIVNGTDNIRSF